MKTKWYILLIIMVALCSCAHKSGHSGGSSRGSQARSRNSGIVATPPQQVTPGDSGGSTGGGGNNGSDSGGGSRKELDGEEIFSRYNTAVFMIYTSGNEGSFQGSGFFISNDGLAVSNYHVFKGTDYAEIKLGEKYYTVSDVVAFSDDNDFILFRVNVPSSTNYIPIADSKPNVGEKVYAIGSPQGLENTFSSGEVSQWRDDNIMQISVPIDHGSSGGALINAFGEVVGITTAGFDSSGANLNFAMSIDVVKYYIR